MIFSRRPLADAVHGLGMRLVVWFEPEKVSSGTWLDQHHPEWLLGQGKQRLLNLGNPDARRWLTDHISKLIQTEGIDIYRHDLSLDPLQYWRDADAPDRQGMTEILYIQGLYEYWDSLTKRNPGLLIDNAASGGRRIDLETLSRSLPLWRFDYFGGEMTAFQAHGAGLALYVPLSSTGVPPTKNNPNVEAPDVYIARSAMSSGLPLTWNLHRPDFDESAARRIVDEIRDVGRFYEGDFYPLTQITAEASKWLALQYDRPELGEGIILAFRRAEVRDESLMVKLHGLTSNLKYEITEMDTQLKQKVTGQELSQGFRLKVAGAPGASLWVYKRRR
jgi:alpha-galactosidase